MGLYSAFYASLSGLSSNSSSLNVIGNNLANLNTVGYKGSSATFQDLFAAALGANSTSGNGNPIQIGLGTRLATVFQNFGRGSFQSTNSVTDMALQGAGFFTLQGKSGARLFSRAGNFTIDGSGFLVDPNGNNVLGWNKNSAGVINTTLPVSTINIPTGITSPATGTRNFGFVTNLNSSAPTGTQFTSTISVYDSLGAVHSLIVTYTKQAAPANTWAYTITTDDAGVNPPTGVVDSGTLAFTSAGTLSSPAGNSATGFSVPWSNGAAAQTLIWNIYSGTPGIPNITQFASSSSTSNSFQDGFGAGTIRNLSVDQNGKIIGNFTNGQTIALAQVSVSMFSNTNGLQKEGDNTWSETLSSGPPSVGLANQGGRGAILGAQLEQSNVDVAEEFTKLIISQRGYQANSRIVTTTDELLQETLNIKR